MNEKILIINIHSSRNLGDAALLQVTLQQISTTFQNAKITLSIDDTASHTGNEEVIESIIAWVHPRNPDGSVHWNYGRLLSLIPATLFPVFCFRIFKKVSYILTPKRLRPIVMAYLLSNLVLSEPGGFLYSSGRGISLLITAYSLTLAILARKPLYILPQSIGPLKRVWERKLIGWLLNHARMVMVREPISQRAVLSIGVHKNRVQLVPDMAFALPASDKTLGMNWLREKGIDNPDDHPLMGMTLINWGEQNKDFTLQKEYEEACTQAIKWFIENTHGKVILFPQVTGPYSSQDDRIPARRVAEQLPDYSSSIYQIEQPLPMELIKSVYGWMDIFIGTRMHSNIFALCENVPVIAIGYLYKTRGISEMIGIDEMCLDIHNVAGNALVDRLSNLWENRQYWKAHISQVMPRLIGEAAKVMGWVKADYEQWLQDP